MSTSEALRDERGAVMVMGIFMSAVLVGALWYVAGIGDAILFREHTQEAADAVAFSAAVHHARGMNLVVLVNLVMATILGLRVALKIGQLVLSIAAASFGALAYLSPAFYALAAPCAAGAEALQAAIDATREPIDQAEKALEKLHDVIARVTPDVAELSAETSVGARYAPTVRRARVTHFYGDTLPIEEGEPDKLCREAGRSVGQLLGWLFEKGGLGNEDPNDGPMKWLGDGIGELAHTSPIYFCEIGSAANPPNLDGMLDAASEERCKRGPEVDRRNQRASEEAWQAKCREARVACKGEEGGEPLAVGVQTGATTPELQRELDRLKLQRDQDARTAEERERLAKASPDDAAACKAWSKDDLKRRQKEQEEARKKAASPGEAPAKKDEKDAPHMGRRVKSDFVNGKRIAQVWAGVRGDEGPLEGGGRAARVGAGRQASRPLALDSAKLPSWAQAEVFYDCGARWSDCNADDDALWHLRWRARLRRFDEPEPLDALAARLGVQDVQRLDLSARTIALANLAAPPPRASNAALRIELQDALREADRGIH